MRRIDEKKLKKRTDLMASAYELFLINGFSGTTIRDIAQNAGVAKGTFYLYFEDKDDIRDAVIRSKAGALLREAVNSLEANVNIEETEAADIFIYIIDYLLDAVAREDNLIQFLSKHLSWGLIRNSRQGVSASGEGDAFDFENYVKDNLIAHNVRIKDLGLLVFTLLEMVSSACYDVILYEKPVSFSKYKPYLNNCVRLLVNNAIEE